MKLQKVLRWVFAISLCVSASVSLAVEAAKQLDLKPGFNFFSKDQDIAAGKDAATKVEQQLPMLNDPQVLEYINNLGHRLTQFEPLPADYPWSFRVVNTRDINAFALPGGYIFVNRGAIEAAENEAQLAGVIAHETGHVVMRHGTHQASQMLLAQAPLSILGGLMGSSGNLMGQLAQMGVGFGVNSVLLHNSRSAESQADEVGTYVLYHAGYDPHAMAQFFKIIEEKYPTKTAQFFSDHPIPANRIQAVDAEIPKLGPPIQGKTDSPEFENIKRRLLGLPAGASQSVPVEKPSSGPMGPVARADVMPGNNFKQYEHSAFTVSYPANWQVTGDADSALTIAPHAGVTQNAIAYGAMINWFQPEAGRGSGKLDDNTHQLIDSLRQANPGLKAIGHDEDIRVSHAAGKSIELTGPSPIQDSSGHALREHDWLVTVQRADGSLLYMVFIAPEQDFQALRPAFQKMVRSLQVK
ncbi:MAG TPA: M48 family metallopeptidase [Terriglobia bacterium]|nr:M48 family metallopeptidase [Terriglobia bacterium]